MSEHAGKMLGSEILSKKEQKKNSDIISKKKKNSDSNNSGKNIKEGDEFKLCKCGQATAMKATTRFHF